VCARCLAGLASRCPSKLWIMVPSTNCPRNPAKKASAALRLPNSEGPIFFPKLQRNHSVSGGRSFLAWSYPQTRMSRNKYSPRKMPSDSPGSNWLKTFSTTGRATFRSWINILWAFPNSLIGLLIGIFGILFGGKVARYGRVLEFWGGPTALILRFFPPLRGAAAITFGHVILYRSAADREAFRAHELVHVRQYEKWGLLFIPAYLASSIAAYLRGQDPYLGNRFEQEAFVYTDLLTSGPARPELSKRNRGIPER